MQLHVLAKRTWMCVAFIAPLVFAVVGFIRRMNMGMLFPVARVGEATITARELAYKRLFAGVGSFVYF